MIFTVQDLQELVVSQTSGGRGDPMRDTMLGASVRAQPAWAAFLDKIRGEPFLFHKRGARCTDELRKRSSQQQGGVPEMPYTDQEEIEMIFFWRLLALAAVKLECLYHLQQPLDMRWDEERQAQRNVAFPDLWEPFQKRRGSIHPIHFDALGEMHRLAAPLLWELGIPCYPAPEKLIFLQLWHHAGDVSGASPPEPEQGERGDTKEWSRRLCTFADLLEIFQTWSCRPLSLSPLGKQKPIPPRETPASQDRGCPLRTSLYACAFIALTQSPNPFIFLFDECYQSYFALPLSPIAPPPEQAGTPGASAPSPSRSIHAEESPSPIAPSTMNRASFELLHRVSKEMVVLRSSSAFSKRIWKSNIVDGHPIEEYGKRIMDALFREERITKTIVLSEEAQLQEEAPETKRELFLRALFLHLVTLIYTRDVDDLGQRRVLTTREATTKVKSEVLSSSTEKEKNRGTKSPLYVTMQQLGLMHHHHRFLDWLYNYLTFGETHAGAFDVSPYVSEEAHAEGMWGIELLWKSSNHATFLHQLFDHHAKRQPPASSSSGRISSLIDRLFGGQERGVVSVEEENEGEDASTLRQCVLIDLGVLFLELLELSGRCVPPGEAKVFRDFPLGSSSRVSSPRPYRSSFFASPPRALRSSVSDFSPREEEGDCPIAVPNEHELPEQTQQNKQEKQEKNERKRARSSLLFDDVQSTIDRHMELRSVTSVFAFDLDRIMEEKRLRVLDQLNQARKLPETCLSVTKKRKASEAVGSYVPDMRILPWFCSRTSTTFMEFFHMKKREVVTPAWKHVVGEEEPHVNEYLLMSHMISPPTVLELAKLAPKDSCDLLEPSRKSIPCISWSAIWTSVQDHWQIPKSSRDLPSPQTIDASSFPYIPGYVAAYHRLFDSTKPSKTYHASSFVKSRFDPPPPETSAPYTGSGEAATGGASVTFRSTVGFPYLNDHDAEMAIYLLRDGILHQFLRFKSASKAFRPNATFASPSSKGKTDTNKTPHVLAPSLEALFQLILTYGKPYGIEILSRLRRTKRKLVETFVKEHSVRMDLFVTLPGESTGMDEYAGKVVGFDIDILILLYEHLFGAKGAWFENKKKDSRGDSRERRSDAEQHEHGGPHLPTVPHSWCVNLKWEERMKLISQDMDVMFRQRLKEARRPFSSAAMFQYATLADPCVFVTPETLKHDSDTWKPSDPSKEPRNYRSSMVHIGGWVSYCYYSSFRSRVPGGWDITRGYKIKLSEVLDMMFYTRGLHCFCTDRTNCEVGSILAHNNTFLCDPWFMEKKQIDTIDPKLDEASDIQHFVDSCFTHLFQRVLQDEHMQSFFMKRAEWEALKVALKNDFENCLGKLDLRNQNLVDEMNKLALSVLPNNRKSVLAAVMKLSHRLQDDSDDEDEESHNRAPSVPDSFLLSRWRNTIGKWLRSMRNALQQALSNTWDDMFHLGVAWIFDMSYRTAVNYLLLSAGISELTELWSTESSETSRVFAMALVKCVVGCLLLPQAVRVRCQILGPLSDRWGRHNPGASRVQKMIYSYLTGPMASLFVMNTFVNSVLPDFRVFSFRDATAITLDFTPYNQTYTNFKLNYVTLPDGSIVDALFSGVIENGTITSGTILPLTLLKAGEWAQRSSVWTSVSKAIVNFAPAMLSTTAIAMFGVSSCSRLLSRHYTDLVSSEYSDTVAGGTGVVATLLTTAMTFNPLAGAAVGSGVSKGLSYFFGAVTAGTTAFLLHQNANDLLTYALAHFSTFLANHVTGSLYRAVYECVDENNEDILDDIQRFQTLFLQYLRVDDILDLVTDMVHAKHIDVFGIFASLTKLFLVETTHVTGHLFRETNMRYLQSSSTFSEIARFLSPVDVNAVTQSPVRPTTPFSEGNGTGVSNTTDILSFLFSEWNSEHLPNSVPLLFHAPTSLSFSSDSQMRSVRNHEGNVLHTIMEFYSFVYHNVHSSVSVSGRMDDAVLMEFAKKAFGNFANVLTNKLNVILFGFGALHYLRERAKKKSVQEFLKRTDQLAQS